MAELKTKVNDSSVNAFLDKVEDEQKRKDCYEIIAMMADITKEPAKMWGTAIIGCGKYHYKYDSGHEGDMCLVGFSPRKANITIYISGGFNETLMKKLGKHKTKGGCLHINKLADIDKPTLKTLIKGSVAHIRKMYP